MNFPSPISLCARVRNWSTSHCSDLTHSWIAQNDVTMMLLHQIQTTTTRKTPKILQHQNGPTITNRIPQYIEKWLCPNLLPRGVPILKQEKPMKSKSILYSMLHEYKSLILNQTCSFSRTWRWCRFSGVHWELVQIKRSRSSHSPAWIFRRWRLRHWQRSSYRRATVPDSPLLKSSTILAIQTQHISGL